jgi:hypothetical protein
VVLHANTWFEVLGVPGMLVDAVDAKEFHAARLDERANGLDEIEVAGLVLAAARGGENDHRVTPGAKHQHVNVLAQMMRIEAAVLFLHGIRD